MQDRLRVAYRLRGPQQFAAWRADTLALEQSIEMPAAAVRDERVLREVLVLGTLFRHFGADAVASSGRGASLTRQPPCPGRTRCKLRPC
jgi:hypothetical protein